MTDAPPRAQPRLRWLPARIATIRDETPTVRTLELEVPGWPGHRAGQHVDVRLTAADGYQAQRSYSIASPPESATVVLSIERVPDGEVSGWLAAEAGVGDVFDVRGPIGGYFVWDAGDPGRLQLVAGGSGVVPLLAMLRHRVAAGGRQPVRLLYSARTADEVIARAELDALAAGDHDVDVIYTFTREAPTGWMGLTRRVDDAMVREVLWPPEVDATTFVCGPTPFVEAVATALIARGHAPDRVRTERFGPTGGS